MQRSERKESDKWDLTKFFKSDEKYEQLYKETLDILEQIIGMKGQLTKDADNLYKYCVLDDELGINLEKIYVYSYLYHYSDTNDNKGLLYRDKADKLDEKVTLETSFVKSELLSVKYKDIKKIIDSDERLAKYAFAFEKLFRYEEHTLSKEEERVISLASNALGSPDNVFSALDNADAKFGEIEVDGKKIELTHSNYIVLLSSKDRDIRKKVFEQYYKFYTEHENSIAEMYRGQVKEDFFFAKVRKFNSPLEMSLYSDDISVDVYKNLIDTIHKNLKPMYDYMDLRKEFFGLDQVHMYDLFVDMVKGNPRSFSFDEAKEIVLDAVKPLGEEYVKDLSKAFENRWIDKYANDGKRSGAYQWGAYRVDPYVSMNFEGNEESVSTMAHELGHAMHSYYSDRTQEYCYAQYPIFLAEIASTVNEVLLNEYFIEHAKDDNERLLFITSFLDKFRATVYRQTMFAEFEMLIHDKEQAGEALTPKELGDTYYNLNKLYYGEKVVSDELIRYEWSRIPHFYTPFYVYKYATGFCAAIAIASDILANKKGAKEKYLEFLKSGSSDYPLEILKRCGVDMTSSEPIIKGIKMFEERLNQAKEIVEKVK